MKKYIIDYLTYTVIISLSLIGCKKEKLPSVTTKEVTEITKSTATSGGIITSDGNSSITAKGICWSTLTGPTTSNPSIDHGPGSDEFTSVMLTLTTNTKYYIRAYATNSIGTAYGKEVSFTTLGKPKLTTITAADITSSSATSGGNISYDGGAAVTERGVCWGTEDSPSITDNTITSGSGTGSYNVTITGLSANTKYFIRAYAKNSIGTGYGNNLSFTTLAK
jgi:hypothetical protein